MSAHYDEKAAVLRGAEERISRQLAPEEARDILRTVLSELSSLIPEFDGHMSVTAYRFAANMLVSILCDALHRVREALEDERLEERITPQALLVRTQQQVYAALIGHCFSKTEVFDQFFIPLAHNLVASAIALLPSMKAMLNRAVRFNYETIVASLLERSVAKTVINSSFAKAVQHGSTECADHLLFAGAVPDTASDGFAQYAVDCFADRDVARAQLLVARCGPVSLFPLRHPETGLDVVQAFVGRDVSGFSAAQRAEEQQFLCALMSHGAPPADSYEIPPREIARAEHLVAVLDAYEAARNGGAM